MKALSGKIKTLVKRLARKLYSPMLVRFFARKAKAEGKRFIFSVIIPVYNTEEYVGESIESVLQQSIGYRHTQIILVDDGSSDGSPAICREYQSRYPENIVVISQENQGVSAARNQGIERADGFYLNFLDSDDKWSKYSFYYTLKFLKKYNCPNTSLTSRMTGEKSCWQKP